ncbi:unnamed protein product, partial [Phaeothamnion confervicola]
IVEFHLVTRRKPNPDKKWWAVTYVQNPEPMVESTFDVKVPSGTNLRYTAPGLANLAPEKSVDGSWDRYFWRVKALPPYQGEPLAPNSLNSMQRIEVSNFDSWTELRSWFEKGWVAATAPTEKIKAQAADLYPADATPEARAQAITAWVAKKRILQMTAEDLQPRPSEQLLGEEVVTPLDGAGLTASLLQAAGIKVQPVLALELPSDRLVGQLPRANRVNQVLLKVTAGNHVWWLDSEHVAELQETPPSGFLGTGALLGDSEANVFVNLPNTDAETNRQESQVEAQVDKDGKA